MPKLRIFEKMFQKSYNRNYRLLRGHPGGVHEFSSETLFLGTRSQFGVAEAYEVMKVWWLWVLLGSVSLPPTLPKKKGKRTTGLKQPSEFKRSSCLRNLRTWLFWLYHCAAEFSRFLLLSFIPPKHSKSKVTTRLKSKLFVSDVFSFNTWS